jgi:RNA polymerase sigma-32 factor
MSNHVSLELARTSGSLDSYLSAVRQVTMLTVDEERALATQLQEEGDLKAAQNLVVAHLRFVVHIAKGYSGYGLPMLDLIQEGNIGLMKAVKRFDPTMNVRLVSYAVHWIRAEIHEFILKNWRIVKVATTKAQRKLFFNLRSSKKRLGWFSNEEVNAVAKDLDVPPETVLEMESRLSGTDFSFDAPTDMDDDEKVTAPAAYLQSIDSDPAIQVEKEDLSEQGAVHLRSALASLDERSRDILEQRWLTDDKATLHELAGQYKVSAERIRQIESSAIKKLKNVLAA